MAKDHIRYIIEGYSTTGNLKNVESALRNSFKLDADIIIKKRSKYKFAISFRTSSEEKIRDCSELDEFFSRLGIMVTRIIIARVITYALESALGAGAVGGVTGGAVSKRLDVGLLIAVLSGLSGYVAGNLVEKTEEIITTCEKSNGRWVRI
ncbi:hypothetical protein [Saccharolobus shibatae]|uniref:Uncharacterized protein n=1 Tax=Saccharolobus shibatae TaxID=2286 RepID=A0A8F5GZ99_9CREN|nr:hypothetical protein [Saccharolobus shibatae]QXJ31916.1 hypothetical protein J5U21_01567 [Saccharolobus shibatae]QXJ34920.1 hypothetical protein J5U22_01467 [Saccharolobus shibatae]